MAYISDETVERVKQAVDIVSLIGDYVDLKRSGASYKGLCPFHGEKTPSFVVTPSRGTFKCFGCQEHGDAISFIMKRENMDFAEAVRFLADRYGIPIEESPAERGASERRKRLYEINKQALLFYYKNLLTSSVPQLYLQGRGMDSSIINRFFLGYADGKGDSLYRYLKEKKFEEEDMMHLGLISKSNSGTGYYDRFRNRLMFPIISHRNKIIGFGGRIIGDGNPKYLNSPESDIFHKGENLYGANLLQERGKKDRVLLVEGYMDVIALSFHGIDFAVASLGTALTTEQAKLIQRFGDKVYLCYDGDKAGIKASRRAIEVFGEQRIVPKLILLPDGKDPDEYCRSEGSEAFLQRLEEAVDPVDFELTILASGYDLGDDKSRLEYLRAVTEFLAGISQAAVRDLYIKKVAESVGVAADSLKEDVLEAERFHREEKKAKAQRTAPRGPENVEEPPPEFYEQFSYEPEEFPLQDEGNSGYDNQIVAFSDNVGTNKPHGESERRLLEYELVRLCFYSGYCYTRLRDEADGFLESEDAKALFGAIRTFRNDNITPSAEMLRMGLKNNECVHPLIDRLEEDARSDFGVSLREMQKENAEEHVKSEMVARELLRRIHRQRLRARRDDLRAMLRADAKELEERGIDRAGLFGELRQIDLELKTEKGGSL